MWPRVRLPLLHGWGHPARPGLKAETPGTSQSGAEATVPLCPTKRLPLEVPGALDLRP